MDRVGIIKRKVAHYVGVFLRLGYMSIGHHTVALYRSADVAELYLPEAGARIVHYHRAYRQFSATQSAHARCTRLRVVERKVGVESHIRYMLHLYHLA